MAEARITQCSPHCNAEGYEIVQRYDDATDGHCFQYAASPVPEYVGTINWPKVGNGSISWPGVRSQRYLTVSHRASCRQTDEHFSVELTKLSCARQISGLRWIRSACIPDSACPILPIYE